MSPNAQIKNLVPENLSVIPPESEWKIGRIWFNTSAGKFQGVFLKLDNASGLPLVPSQLEVRTVGVDVLGPTRDGTYWPDGLFNFTEQTKISDAMDVVNEALKDLAPPEATFLRGDLVVFDQKMLTGRISKLNAACKDVIKMSGASVGTLINYIITNPNVKANLPVTGLFAKGKKQQQFGRADKGVMTVIVDEKPTDVGLNLYQLFNESGRDHFGIVQGYDQPITQSFLDVDGISHNINANPNKNNYKSSSGSLTIGKVERYNDFKKWQCGSGIVNVAITPGYHVIKVEHTGIIPDLVCKTNDLQLFYDTNNIKPICTIMSFLVSNGDKKYISGIPFYTKNISFALKFKAENVFSYTYWDYPISLKIQGDEEKLLAWNDPSSNLNTVDVPFWDDNFTLNSYVIDFNQTNTYYDKITLVTKAGKPSTGWGDEIMKSINILIDTNPINSNSTPTKETFLDEDYRIRIDGVDTDNVLSVATHTKNTWLSNVPLRDGEAQQMFGALIKAKDNFSLYNTDVDYSIFNKPEQVYYRRFFIDNKPNSNGTLKIDTDGIIGVDFDLFIKLPSVTAWLNTNVLFDIETFINKKNINGTGCGVGLIKTTNGYEIPWSTGNLSTHNSGFGYLIKVVLKNDDTKITGIEEISKNWR